MSHYSPHFSNACDTIEREPSLPVYIVDDDEAVLASLGLMLQVDGFIVQGFTTAQSFIGEVATLAPGLILMDYHIGAEDGIAATVELVRRGVTWRTILMTSWLEPDQRLDAKAAGIEEIFEKPFNLDRLLASLRA